MMKRWAGLLVAAVLMLLCTAAGAELHIGQRPPEEWADKDTLRVRAIDVDRSDAMLLSCGGEHMLVDASTTYFGDRVIRALDDSGVEKLKYLFSTHSDDDHIGGFSPVIRAQRYEIGEFLSPNGINYKDKAGFHQLVMAAVRKFDVSYREVEDSEVLTLGDAQMTVLRCLKPWGRNARSACLSIRFGESTMLLTGDIETMAMEHFLEKYDHALLNVDIVKAPHHGIITMPDSFMQVAQPAFMFVPNTAAKAEKFGENMAKTAPDVGLMYSGDGAVVMETDGTDWYIWQEENWE